MNNTFERDVLDRLTRLETKIDMQDYKGLSEKVEITHNKADQNEKDIIEINDKLKWLSRTITGAIIGGIISLLFILIKMSIGV